jgi:hypothetical protein
MNVPRLRIVLCVLCMIALLALSATAYSAPQSPAAPAAQICTTATGESYPCAARAPTQQEPDAGADAARFRVAVFHDEDIFFADELVAVLNMDPDIEAISVSRLMIESGTLNNFDCLATRLLGPPENDRPTAATIAAIQAFVARGGGYVGEWWGAGAALSGPAPSVNGDYYVPARFLNLFAGRASDGNYVQTNNPITIVRSHPVTQGLPSTFASGGGTEFFVRPVPPFDPRLSILATYEGHNGTHPAIMVGQTGRSNAVLLFFDAIDEPRDPNLTILWRNAVRFACTPPVINVPLDIKPMSCPNPINTKSRGVLPVAIAGTKDLDVTKIDPSSLRLAGVAPLRSSIEDVATPFLPLTGKSKANDCTTRGRDGIRDLTLKFDTQAVVAALGAVRDREVRVLSLTGRLKAEFGGTPLQGEDVVRILHK